jgi:hypothetical protein
MESEIDLSNIITNDIAQNGADLDKWAGNREQINPLI